MTTCKHELPEGTCGTCAGFLDVHADWEQGAKFEAQFDGRCADTTCRGRIEEGDIIIKWFVDDAHCYTHEG